MTAVRAVQITSLGGLDRLHEAELPDPVPGDGEVLVDVEAAGVNFADIERIAGTYLPPELPFVPGGEVVGRTADGTRVMAFARGGYATKAVVKDPVEIPPAMAAGEALALLVQGLTAWHLLRTAARVRQGDSVVVNAGAGGVGHLAVQLAKEFGASRVIATASTEAKRELALSLGADAAVDGSADGYAARITSANGGQGADIVLDAVGGPVFDAAVDALAPFGRIVAYGTSSGVDPSPVDVDLLTNRNASVTGFWVGPTLRMPGMLDEPLRELVRLTVEGRLRPVVGGEYKLADARPALEDLAARRTHGKIVLLP
ncbi:MULTISPECIES: quinone oxidoreductase family protein [Nonomuraea]|uniref:Zinc-binding alcohol dehydrogenase family protein n=1 Tax=Nonomuraea mangrovi TaxID=2316207 RepID=A0ABW4STS5_9ACTN